jgi:hypothetical protein
MKYLDGDSAIQQHFETMQNRLDKEIETLKGQIEESEMARATFDELLEFTRKMPSNLDEIWTGLHSIFGKKFKICFFVAA